MEDVDAAATTDKGGRGQSPPTSLYLPPFQPYEVSPEVVDALMHNAVGCLQPEDACAIAESAQKIGIQNALRLLLENRIDLSMFSPQVSNRSEKLNLLHSRKIALVPVEHALELYMLSSLTFHKT